MALIACCIDYERALLVEKVIIEVLELLRNSHSKVCTRLVENIDIHVILLVWTNDGFALNTRISEVLLNFDDIVLIAEVSVVLE
jgi:hypothetical protein